MTTRKRIDTPFNIWLDQKLKQRHMSAAKLADEAGLARSTISRWYREGREPDVKSIRAITKALDIHPDDLLEVLDLRDGATDRISPAVRRAQHLMDKTSWTESMIEMLERSIKFIQSGQTMSGEDSE